MAQEVLKQFKYKGKTLEELKLMSFEDLSVLFPSSFRRKINRGFTEAEEKLLKKIKNNQKNIKTHARDMIVLPLMVGFKIGVHNGREFVDLKILEEMLGHRLGEFAMTRKIAVHTSMGAKKTTIRK